MSIELPIEPKPVEKIETGKKVFDFLERIKFLDIRKSDESFEEWIQNLSYDNFIYYITRLNGILRASPIKDRELDRRGVELSTEYEGAPHVRYMPPATELKSGMLRDVFDVLKKISNNEDRALLIYYALQAIHPYSDGNGRTGRLLYEVISQTGKELDEEHMSELLDHDIGGAEGVGDGREVFARKVETPEIAYEYINREVARDFLGANFTDEYGYITTVVGKSGHAVLPESLKGLLSKEDAVFAEKILTESGVAGFPFSGIVLIKFIEKYPEFKECQSDGNLKLPSSRILENIGKKSITINATKIYNRLTPDHIRQLIEIHKEVKSRFIQIMIDVFANPDKYQLKNKDGNSTSIVSFFRL